jgi:hypothetical protein
MPEELEVEWAIRWAETDDEREVIETGLRSEAAARDVVDRYPDWNGSVIRRVYGPWVTVQ